MAHDPLARLNLTPPEWPEPAADTEPVAPEALQDFPPVVAELASAPAGGAEFPAGGSPVEASLAQVPREPLAALDDAPALPPPLTALDRYRLENDRELLRKLAYQRVFVNGRD